MPKYEYQILHQLGSRVPHLNTQMNGEVDEGWVPIAITGDQAVSVLMRRIVGEDAGAPEEE
jgi:hypothetical protein